MAERFSSSTEIEKRDVDSSKLQANKDNNEPQILYAPMSHSDNPDHEHDTEAYPASLEKGGAEKGDIVRNLTRTLTKTSTKNSWNPGPPPDGGRMAWTQAAMGHLVVFNTWGFVNSFGVFQSYYVTALGLPPSDIAWIGSIQVFLLFFVGTFTGRLTDAGYFRYVFGFGTFIACLGTFMASISTTYWQLLLTQGICAGLGSGCLFCPSLAVLSTYFSKKRSLAIGISASGSATGGIIYPIMVQKLLPQIGFSWTMRSLAFVQLGCLLIANCFVRPRLPPRKTGAIVEWAAFKELPYSLFAIGMFFNFWGVYFAFYYITSYGRTMLAFSQIASINLLIILNGVGVIGRVLPNFLADRYFGPLNLIIPATTASSILIFSWMAVKSQTGLYVFAVVYGIVGAMVQGLFPAVLSSLTTDLRKAGTRMGMVFTIVAFAVLTGPPLDGALIQADGGDYKGAQEFAGACLAIGTSLLAVCRWKKSRGKFWVKM